MRICNCGLIDRRTLLRGAGATALAMLAFPAVGNAFKIRAGTFCGLSKDRKLPAMTGLEASEKADRVVAEICGIVGLPANFRVLAIDDPKANAFASIQDGERLVVYSEPFMELIADRQNRDWSGMAVFAHEIGHHLCGHTLDNVGSRPPQELEADHFAGFIVGRLGGDLDDATRVFARMGTGSATHPPSAERVAAASAGWRKATGKAGEDRLNVLTHNLKDGNYVRVVVEFSGRDRRWTEVQHGQTFAVFEELKRKGRSVFLFDEGRSIWVRLDVDGSGQFATGFWARGDRQKATPPWSPLDPVAWR